MASLILCCRKYNAYEVKVGWIFSIKNLRGCQKHKVWQNFNHPPSIWLLIGANLVWYEKSFKTLENTHFYRLFYNNCTSWSLRFSQIMQNWLDGTLQYKLIMTQSTVQKRTKRFSRKRNWTSFNGQVTHLISTNRACTSVAKDKTKELEMDKAKAKWLQ